MTGKWCYRDTILITRESFMEVPQVRFNMGKDIAALDDILIDIRQVLFNPLYIFRSKTVFLHHLSPERASCSQIISDVAFSIEQVDSKRFYLLSGYCRH